MMKTIRPLLLSVFFVTALPAFALRSDLGVSFQLGPQFNYGNGYVSLNNPGGLKDLNMIAGDIKSKSLAETVGITTELMVRYTILDRYFFMLGGSYTAGVRTQGQYPLRSPFTGELLEASGGSFVGSGLGEYIPINGYFQQSHYGVPLHFGLVINFWNELRVILGPGVGFYWAKMISSQASMDTDLLPLTVKSEFSSFIIAYHMNLIVEYLVIGSPEDRTRLGLLAGIQYTHGQSSSLTDKQKGDDIPGGTPVAPPPEAIDSAKINLSGYRAFFGVTYYFFATK